MGVAGRAHNLDSLDNRLYAAVSRSPAAILIIHAQIREGAAAVNLDAGILLVGLHRIEDGLDRAGVSCTALVPDVVGVEMEEGRAAVLLNLDA